MQRLAGHQSKPVRSLEVPLLHIEPVACGPASGYVRHPCGFIEPCLRSSGWILSTPPALMVRVILSHKAGRSHDIGDTTEVRTNYEPQSDAATGGMLASATGMAAASSFGHVFIGTIVSALLPGLS